MSESNNNTPMRITQLQEATAYEDGMYYAVAKAGSGTKKISCDTPTKEEINLNNIINLFKTYDLSYSNLYYNGGYSPQLNDGIWSYAPTTNNFMKSTTKIAKKADFMKMNIKYKSPDGTLQVWAYNNSTPIKIIASLPQTNDFVETNFNIDLKSLTVDEFNLCLQCNAEKTISVYSNITFFNNQFSESNINDILSSGNFVQAYGNLKSSENDFDSIKNNTITYGNGTVSANNLPSFTSDKFYGANIDFCPNKNTKSGAIQLYAFGDGNLFYRNNIAGNFYRWKPLRTINMIGGLRKVGIIGDSVSNGLVYNLDGSYQENPDQRWGNVLFKGQYGADVSFVTQSGATPKTILNGFDTELQELSDRQVVIVYLGHNSMSGGIGTPSDIVSSWDETPSNDTYYGWYSKLILTLQHYMNANARIICFGVIYTEQGANECIEYLANLYNCYFVSIKQFRTELTVSNMGDGTHFTALGYSYFAQLVGEEIDKLLYKNRADFGNIGKIV